MKYRMPLYLLFLRVVLKQSLRVAVPFFLFYLVITKLGLTDLRTLNIFSFSFLASAFFAFLALIFTIPRNYSWLLISNFSKSQLITLQMSVNFTILLIGVIQGCLMSALLTLVLLGPAQITLVLKNLTDFYHSSTTFFGDITPDNSTAFIVVSLMAFFMLFSNNASRHQMNQLIIRTISFKRIKTYLGTTTNLGKATGIILAMIFALLPFSHEYITSPFGTFIWFNLIILFFIPYGWRLNLFLAGKKMKAAFMCFLFIGLLEIGLVYQSFTREMNESPDKKVEALLFLGPFVGTLSPSDFSSLLQLDLSAESITKIGNRFMDTFHEGKQLERKAVPELNFSTLISSKTDIDAVYRSYQLYNPKTISASDLKVIFRALEGLNDAPEHYPLFLRFVEADVTDKEMQEFFESNDPWENRYALLRSRYLAKPDYLWKIINNMKKYQGVTLVLAIDTVSILQEMRFTFQDWHKLNLGSLTVFDHFNGPIQCDKFQFKSLNELKPEHEGLLNTCIRRKADKSEPYLLSDIENVGWFEVPLKGSALRVSKQIYRNLKDYKTTPH